MQDFSRVADALEEIARALRGAAPAGSATAAGSEAEWHDIEAPAPASRAFSGEVRHYCVWVSKDKVPEIVQGEHPAVWDYILSKAGPEVSTYAGSGLRIKRYDSLELAQAGWKRDAPSSVRRSLPTPAPIANIFN